MTMKHMQSKQGYILILTVMIIAGITAIVTSIFNRGVVYVPFAHTMIAREKAKMLALGGVAVAQAQLAYKKEKKGEQGTEKQSQKKENPKDEAAKTLLMQLL